MTDFLVPNLAPKKAAGIISKQPTISSQAGSNVAITRLETIPIAEKIIAFLMGAKSPNFARKIPTSHPLQCDHLEAGDKLDSATKMLVQLITDLTIAIAYRYMSLFAKPDDFYPCL